MSACNQMHMHGYKQYRIPVILKDRIKYSYETQVIANINFEQEFGFEAPPRLQFAIKDFYSKCHKPIKKSFFKECKHYLACNPVTGRLKVHIKKIDMIAAWFVRSQQILALIPSAIFLIVSMLFDGRFVIFTILFSAIFLYYAISIRPYYLAKKIKKELEIVYPQKRKRNRNYYSSVKKMRKAVSNHFCN
jgi:hypothetical protein